MPTAGVNPICRSHLIPPAGQPFIHAKSAPHRVEEDVAVQVPPLGPSLLTGMGVAHPPSVPHSASILPTFLTSPPLQEPPGASEATRAPSHRGIPSARCGDAGMCWWGGSVGRGAGGWLWVADRQPPLSASPSHLEEGT